MRKIDAGANVFEFSEWLVTADHHSLRIVIVYRPPRSNVSINTFCTEFLDYLEPVLLCKEQLLITGDFNIHVDVFDDPDALKLRDLFDSVGLKQHVTQPTHIHGHTLDLVITRLCENTLLTPPYPDRYISDHASLICELHPVKPPPTVKKITYRKLKSVDIQSLKRDLVSSDLCNDLMDGQTDSTVNGLIQLVQSYNDTLSEIINRHAPFISRTMRVRPAVPWYDDNIKAAKRKRRKGERRWRKTGLPSDFNAFKTIKNQATHLMNQARRSCYTDFVNNNSSDQGKLFRAAKKTS